MQSLSRSERKGKPLVECVQTVHVVIVTNWAENQLASPPVS